MNDRSYRSVANPASLGPPERDALSGRRTADRSDKDRQRHRPRRVNRTVLIGAAALAVLLLLAGTAVAVRSSGSNQEAAATTRQRSAGSSAPATSAGSQTEGSAAAGDGSDLDGQYDLTRTVTERLSYTATGTRADPQAVGTSSTQPMTVACDGATCMVSTNLPVEEFTRSGNTLTGSRTETLPKGASEADCPSVDAIDTVELTISPEGAVTGKMVEDHDPGYVTCGTVTAIYFRTTWELPGTRRS